MSSVRSLPLGLRPRFDDATFHSIEINQALLQRRDADQRIGRALAESLAETHDPATRASAETRQTPP